ncbi:MAG: winged helix-turn-helix domain-containing protein [Candidatus Brocadiia bacterium]
MKLENVKVGETYTLAVGKNAVQVTVTGVGEKGKITVTTAGGKTITVADAGRLAVHREGRASAPDTNAPQAAHGAHGKAAAPKATKTASGRNVREKGAPRGEEKRLGLVDAAIQVMQETGEPMNCRDVVKAVLEQKLWTTDGKTPAATLYAAILREVQKKGTDARFKKVERGQFALTA